MTLRLVRGNAPSKGRDATMSTKYMQQKDVSPEPDASEDDSDKDVYMVDCILDERKTPAGTQYLIKWYVFH